MKSPFSLKIIALVAGFSAVTTLAEDAPAPSTDGQITVYRQVMPDGRVVYSDKALKEGKIDHTITIEPPIKGNLWTTESSQKPVIPPQTERTPINRVSAIPVLGKRKTMEEAASDVIRAEMLLEDAKKQQEAGAKLLPGEAKSSYAYEARQKSLAADAAEAETALTKAIAARNALQNAR